MLVLLSSCTKKEEPVVSKKNAENKAESRENYYRYYWGEKDGFKVWIVDGSKIRRDIFNEFIYGGNDERYVFNPENEILIDNSISAEEFETTLAHEINERQLMAKFGWTYFDAHDSSLMLELQMRRNYVKESLAHESKLPKVVPVDFDSTQEIVDLPNKIKLKNIYRIPLGERQRIKIWVVDGYTVRKDIYPDFGFSGNDLAYHFIPEREIWIDGSIICEETEYSIALELKEREEMSKGKEYDSAYLTAVKITDSLRKANYNFTLKHEPLKIPVILIRDTGTGKLNTDIKK